MKDVGNARHQTKEVVGARKEQLDSLAGRIGLGCFDGDNTAKGWKWESTATSLIERCTTGSKPDGEEVNSLKRKKPNQTVQKAAQSMALSKSARLDEKRIRNIKF